MRFLSLLAVLLLACQQATPQTPPALRVSAAPAAPSADVPAEAVVAPSVRIYAGLERTCAITGSGVLKCWGRDDRKGADAKMPLSTVIATAVREVAIGEAHTCAVLVDGSVVCWGRDYDGSIGVPADAECDVGKAAVPCVTMPTRVKNLPPAVAIAAGQHNSCIVSDQGTVHCWGMNAYGQLGTSTSERCFDKFECSRVPVRVQGLDRVTRLALGATFSCALRQDGSVWCWGANESGELGRGSRDEDRHSPGRVQLPVKAIQVDAGLDYVCALSTEHHVFCWGANNLRQLGASSPEQDESCSLASTPLAVPGLRQIASLSLARWTSCALGRNGSLWCWGDKTVNAMGIASAETCSYRCKGVNVQTDCIRSPQRVPGIPKLSSVANGADHACGFADGNVVCWGDWYSGQLGFPPKRCTAEMSLCLEPAGVVEL